MKKQIVISIILFIFTLLCLNSFLIGKNIDKSKNSKNTWWNCQCKCGKIFTATTTDINKQRAKSCGCMKS